MQAQRQNRKRRSRQSPTFRREAIEEITPFGSLTSASWRARIIISLGQSPAQNFARSDGRPFAGVGVNFREPILSQVGTKPKTNLRQFTNF